MFTPRSRVVATKLVQEEQGLKTDMYVILANVPSKLCACAHDFSTSAHRISLLAYVRIGLECYCSQSRPMRSQ